MLPISKELLVNIAEEYGTPCYVYSKQRITNNFLTFEKSFKNLNPLICYAIKANSNLSILKLLSELGAGFDIVSEGELQCALHTQSTGKNIVFSGVGKTTQEIKAALQTPILSLNVESTSELSRINSIAASMGLKAPVSLRINPDVDAKTHPYISTGLHTNKFGIPTKEGLAICQNLEQWSNINLIGLDCHIGSQITEAQPLIDAAKAMLTFMASLPESVQKNISHLNLGGGFGIPYHQDDKTIDLSQYAKALESILKNHSNLQLIFEPGRYLLGDAGVLITTVEYTKKPFAIVDAGMNDLIRPSLYNAWHNIEVITNSKAPCETWNVVGPVCESGDFFGKDRKLSLTEGDIVAIADTGAYGFTQSSNYNIRMRPPEVLVDNDQHTLIRQKETWEQIMHTQLATSTS